MAPEPYSALRHPWPVPPAPGSLELVAPGVFWLRMPLPFALDHINLWVLEDGDGWTLVDCGIDREEVRALWEALFARELAGRPVKRIVATHFHPDHLGLAGWLADRSGAPLWMTREEWLVGSLNYHDPEARIAARQTEFFRHNGLGGPTLDSLSGRGNRYRALCSTPPPSYRRMVDGEVFDIGGSEWTVVTVSGHAPEHACLYCAELNVLIAGDQVLPSITPNVTLSVLEPDGDPLREFLASLRQLENFPRDCLVLPSHGLPFVGLHRRLGATRAHHHRRLQRVLESCDRPHTAAELLPVLFRRELDLHQVMFAMGESLAHLAWLRHAGRLERSTGDDGITRYAPAG